LIYNKSYMPSLKAERVGVVIAFTAVFEHELLSCTNNPKSYLHPHPNHKVVRIESNDVALIHGKFVQLLNEKREQPPRRTGSQLPDWRLSAVPQAAPHRSNRSDSPASESTPR